MHNRRARPTLRVLTEDLTSEWGSPHPPRAIADGNYFDLHPVSELPHPIIEKAKDSFGPEATHDNFVGPIASATRVRLLEIKQSQWRGGVWEDSATGVCWLVVAGLAKGGHRDHDDFYNRVQRENDSGGTDKWLPTERDVLLLKQETAARLQTQWELDIQRNVRDILLQIHDGGERLIEIEHPVPSQGKLASVTLTISPVREDDYEADEILVEIAPESRFQVSEILWTLTTRILISIAPPEQGWDRYQDTYTNIGEIGAWKIRADELNDNVTSDTLATSCPGTVSHFSHRKHLANSTINGTGVRALCGVFFVPTQDHQSLPECPNCQDLYARLPA